MSKIEGVCREVIDKAEWIAIATSGAAGAHLAGTWGEYIRSLCVEKEEIILIPVGGYRTTEQNLVSDNRIELLCATKQVQGAHGPGKGCRIRGTGQIQTSGDRFASAKKKFPWARGVLVVKVEEVSAQL